MTRSLASTPQRWLWAMVLIYGLVAWQTTKLELRADLLSMLPEEVPAARAYKTFLEEFGGLEQVFVVVTPVKNEGEGDAEATSTDPDRDVLDTALHLEEVLQAEPLIGSVRAGVEESDERFFLEYVVPRTVLRDESWSKDRVASRLTSTALIERVRVLREKVRNPVSELEVKIAKYDPLGFAEDALFASASELGLSVDPLSGVFRSSSGSALLMIQPTASEIDSSAGLELAKRLQVHFDSAVSRVGGRVAVQAVGGPLYAAADEELIRSDLESTISVSVIGCLLVLMLAFGSWRATFVATVVLGSALGLTFGSLSLLRGEMLAVSLGFAAVLIGLGVDYVIHAVTRYRQSLDQGSTAADSLVAMYRDSTPPLLASALTTAAAFGVLLFSAIRPLQEIGSLVAVGIVCMLACTLLLGGPLMAIVLKGAARGRLSTKIGVLWGPLGKVAATLQRIAQARPRTVLVCAAIVLVSASWMARDLQFAPRFEDLRTADHPLEEAERRLAEEFGMGQDSATILVSGRDFGEALTAAERITRGLKTGTLLTDTEIAVSSPTSVLMTPSSTKQRLRELKDLPWAEAADTLERLMPEVGLAARAFQPGLDALRALGRGEEPLVGRDLAWPDWVESQIARKSDGEATVALRLRTSEEGSAVLAGEAARAELETAAWEVRAPRASDSTQTAEPQALRSDRQEPRVQVASAFALGEQMRTVGEREVGWLAAASLLMVVLVVALSVGFSPTATVLALLPTVMGVAVAFAALELISGRLDFLSLAIVPMLFGIGIDDGLHALCGTDSPARRGPISTWRDRSRQRLREVPARVHGASRAITLTTLTTVVGFGSLATSSMPGLKSGGEVVAIGVTACWLTTLMVVPAIATLLFKETMLFKDTGLFKDTDPLNSPSESSPDGQPAENDGFATAEQQRRALQAPEVSQRWMRRLGFLHFSSPFWYRLHAVIMRWFPSWLIAVLMWPILLAFFLALGNVRRALVQNRKAVSGPSRFGSVGDLGRGLMALYNYAWCFSETYEGLFNPATRSLSKVFGEDNWHAVTSSRSDEGEEQGFVIATAHVGHWEVGSHLSKFERPRKVNVVREPEMNPRAQEFMESLLNQGDDHYQVHFARADDAMLGGRLLSALRRGEILALQGDRPRVGGKTLRVSLFDRPFELPVGPFAMARAARVPILPVFVFREGRRKSELHLRARIDVPRSRDRTVDLQWAAQRFASEVEWAISHRPEQWFCLRVLWPEGEEL